jgi:hypothetical protein
MTYNAVVFVIECKRQKLVVTNEGFNESLFSMGVSFNSILQLTTDGECLKDQIVQSAEFPSHAIRRLVEIHTSMTVAPGFAQTMCAREI